MTILTWGTPVYHCETAMHMLASPPESIIKHVPASVRSAKVELIDLRTILPWDVEAVEESYGSQVFQMKELSLSGTSEV